MEISTTFYFEIRGFSNNAFPLKPTLPYRRYIIYSFQIGAKKSIYGFTVNTLFTANIQFISFGFHNLVIHGKYHPHIQHHFLFCTT